MEQWIVEVTGGSAIAVAAISAGFWLVRSRKARALAAAVLVDAGDQHVLDATQEDVRTALENLRTVVDSQGEAIEWLRSELEATRRQLDAARKQLAEAQKFHSMALEAIQENESLRARVAELEAQVHALESELEARSARARKAAETRRKNAGQ